MKADRLEVLRYFVRERESIRREKEMGFTQPWTKDPILHQYKFCNVKREDDRTTREIHQVVKDNCPHYRDLPRIYTLARICNVAHTVDIILEHPRIWPELIADELERGEIMFSNAYTTTPCGRKMTKIEFMVEISEAHKAMTIPDSTCGGAFRALKSIKGLGDFMAGQIVADLKHTEYLRYTPDHRIFVVPGPGSIAGLDILWGTLDTNTTNFEERIWALWWALPRDIRAMVEDMQNLQNVCCEFAKYWRYKHGLSRRKRLYPHVG